jgi:glycosyltransferase involved in cell wall biosynthesis
VRVALVVPGGFERSLAERVIPALLWLVEELGRRVEVVVFALGHGPAPGEWEVPGARVVDLGPLPLSRLPGVAFLRRAHRLRSLLRDRGPFDVVHAFWATPSGATAAAAATGLPLVVSLAGGELAGIAAIGYGCDLVPRERRKVRWTLAQAEAVTAASRPLADEAARRGFDARLVPLGVEDAGFLARSAGAPGAPFRLLHAADLNRVKDTPTLLRAARRLRDRGLPFVLDVAGEDTLGGAVEAEAARLGLGGSVVFHGRLPTTRLRPLLREADLFLLSSRHEAGPVAVVEAAACSVPTVGTAVGHVLEGDPGRSLAVPVGDDAALAEAATALLSDPARRAAMGAAARAWAFENRAAAGAARFVALYEEVIGRGDRGPRSRPSR